MKTSSANNRRTRQNFATRCCPMPLMYADVAGLISGAVSSSDLEIAC